MAGLRGRENMRTRTRRISIFGVMATIATVVAWPASANGVAPLASGSPTVTSTPTFTTPIQHVVYMVMENHSFDNVLGAWCVQTGRCDGAMTGNLYGSSAPYSLTQAKDGVVQVIHSGTGQTKAIDGGKMDGFSLLAGCTASTGYKCYSQYLPSQTSIQNVTTLASAFAVSDRTFEDNSVASWGMHLESISANLDGFIGGGTPHPCTKDGYTCTLGPGWGCDSGRDTEWKAPTGKLSEVPACVPDPSLDPATYPYGGAYRSTPVQYIPTIMDRLGGTTGLTWKMYAGLSTTTCTKSSDNCGYGWAACPSYAECLYGSSNPMAASTQVITDAQNGVLPNFAVVTPTQTDSQHNGDSMATGDGWIGQVINAITSGPEWGSTAVFLTWDDCGCFYDHVAPPAGMGIRVPMIIISPYAIAQSTDHNTASFNSVLAFTEYAFGLQPLGSSDQSAYNFLGSFNFLQAPINSINLASTHPIPLQELQALREHPPDPADPT